MVGLIKVRRWLVFDFVAELRRGKPASAAPWARNLSNLSMRDILDVTWPCDRPFCNASRPDYPACEKQICFEKSSFYSTKEQLISAYWFSFTFDEITAFISNSEALRFLTFFQNSFQAGNQLIADAARSANQDQVIMPSWLPKAPSWLRENAFCLSQSAFSIFPRKW